LAQPVLDLAQEGPGLTLGVVGATVVHWNINGTYETYCKRW
jgi:hypothetical protein